MAVVMPNPQAPHPIRERHFGATHQRPQRHFWAIHESRERHFGATHQSRERELPAQRPSEPVTPPCSSISEPRSSESGFASPDVNRKSLTQGRGSERAPRFRVALEYAIRGDLRFISHHDEIRLLTRALVRGRWPVSYSQGFNPVPRLSIPLPRSVGMASERQLAVVELEQERSAAELAASLAATMPGDAPLRTVWAPAATGTPHPQAATYEVEWENTPADLAQRIADVMARPEVSVRREYGDGKPARALNIRPWLGEIEPLPGGLRMRLQYVASQTARPNEVLMALGLDAGVGQAARRVAVTWDMDLCGPQTVRCNQEEIR